MVYQEGTARAKRKKDLRVANTVWDIENAFNEAVEELEQEGYDFAEERWAPVEDT
jgi:vacuolar-type H+-ATPase subunit I/STV1